MTRKQADAAFDSLRRHSSAITPPSGPAGALALLDRAVLSRLQRDAMVHYISVGPDNLALAYSVVKAGAATFAAAHLDTLDAGHERDTFASRMIALAESLEAAEPAERATRLLDSFTGHVTAGRERLAALVPVDAGGSTAAEAEITERPAVAAVVQDATIAQDGEGATGADRAGDLLEAAGIAYLIGQLLESPPRPTATRR